MTDYIFVRFVKFVFVIIKTVVFTKLFFDVLLLDHCLCSAGDDAEGFLALDRVCALADDVADARCVDALRDEVVAEGAGACLRERLVDGVCAGVVCPANDVELHVVVSLEH